MRKRQHLNPMGLSFEEYRDVVPVLDPSKPVEIEIGCAEAQFLFERAVAQPNAQYFGLEIRDVLVRTVNRQAKAQGVPVQALLCQVNLHLDKVFAKNSVDRAHVLFPDPWFKRRQQKRRVVDEKLARDIHRILKPGGELHFATDVWELAIGALPIFEGAEKLFANVCGPWSFWKSANPYQARSWREMNCDDEGMPVWRLIYKAL